MNTLLRQLLIIGLCLIPLVPLVVADFLFFPFITGKNFAFRILVEITFALWAILALRDPSLRPRWSSLPILMLAFVVSAGISAFLAENPLKAFWSNFERMEGWIGLVHSTAYFFVLWLTMNSEKLWSRFWNTSITVSAIIGLYGLFQLGGLLTINQGGVRVDGTLGNATYLAVYMLFHVFITLFYTVRTWKTETWLRYLYIPTLVLQSLMIFYSATRGTILGLVGGLFLSALIVVFLQKDNLALKRWGIGVSILILLLVGSLFAVKDTSFVQNDPVLSRIAGISLEDGKTRFTIWGMALQGFQDRPIFGWGQEGFNYVFNTYYQPSLYAQEPWFDRAHNAFIDWLVAGGLVGFLLYCSFYLLAGWLIWRPGPTFSITEKALISGLLAAYAFHNLFVFDNLVSYMFFMSVLAYIAFRTPMNSLSAVRKPVSDTRMTFAIPAVVATALVVFYFANVPGIATAMNIIKGIQPHESITENFDYFKKATESFGVGSQEVREQLLQFAIQVKRLNAGDASFQDTVAQFAVDQMESEIARAPNDARLQLFLGSFWQQFNRPDEAVSYLLRAHELSPGKQQIIFELGILEYNRGNLEEALRYLKQAFDLAPGNDSARSFYATALIRAGNMAEASALMIDAWGTDTPDNNFILQAYLDVKDFAKVVNIARARVEKDPENAEMRVQLAAAYLASGDRQSAIAALQKAIELNPGFKEQGEFYINEIQAGRNP